MEKLVNEHFHRLEMAGIFEQKATAGGTIFDILEKSGPAAVSATSQTRNDSA